MSEVESLGTLIKYNNTSLLEILLFKTVWYDFFLIQKLYTVTFQTYLLQILVTKAVKSSSF